MPSLPTNLLTHPLATVTLLICSNVFMTYAWYYHLKHKAWPLLLAIVLSWGIAFFEYVLQVPANRYGHLSNGGTFTAPQLKIIQEVITLTVFGMFSVLVLGEKLRTNDVIAFGLVLAAVVVSMWGKR